jgi:hypothetical protein
MPGPMKLLWMVEVDLQRLQAAAALNCKKQKRYETKIN